MTLRFDYYHRNFKFVSTGKMYGLVLVEKTTDSYRSELLDVCSVSLRGFHLEFLDIPSGIPLNIAQAIPSKDSSKSPYSRFILEFPLGIPPPTGESSKIPAGVTRGFRQGFPFEVPSRTPTGDTFRSFHLGFLQQSPLVIFSRVPAGVLPGS